MSQELSSIVFIKHTPDGFEEKEMIKFFSQYGVVKNARLSRSPKTGNSRHYGWIEFENPEIAQIVSKSMDNYLLFEKKIQSSVLTTANVPQNLFINGRRGPKAEKDLKPLSRKELALKLAQQERKIISQLNEKGIKYQWNSFIDQLEKYNVTVPL